MLKATSRHKTLRLWQSHQTVHMKCTTQLISSYVFIVICQIMFCCYAWAWFIFYNQILSQDFYQAPLMIQPCNIWSKALALCKNSYIIGIIRIIRIIRFVKRNFEFINNICSSYFLIYTLLEILGDNSVYPS